MYAVQFFFGGWFLYNGLNFFLTFFPQPSGSSGLSHELIRALSRVMNLLNLELLDWLRPYGATVQQFRVMQVIAVLGVASIGEIAQDAVIEQPVVSRVVDQLEARKFARRRKRTNNGRIVEVTQRQSKAIEADEV